MNELITQSKFWNSPYRIVIHNTSDNSIQSGKHIFSWNNFFEVNKIVV